MRRHRHHAGVAVAEPADDDRRIEHDRHIEQQRRAAAHQKRPLQRLRDAAELPGAVVVADDRLVAHHDAEGRNHQQHDDRRNAGHRRDGLVAAVPQQRRVDQRVQHGVDALQNQRGKSDRAHCRQVFPVDPQIPPVQRQVAERPDRKVPEHEDGRQHL